MMTKRSRLAILSAVVMLGIGIAGLGYIANRITHRGAGPHRTFPLASDTILTDEQAVSLAKQTLQLDGRFSEAMELEAFGDGNVVNRGDDKTYVSLSWRYPGTNDRWFVQLHRTPERVEAVSYPGK